MIVKALEYSKKLHTPTSLQEKMDVTKVGKLVGAELGFKVGFALGSIVGKLDG